MGRMGSVDWGVTWLLDRGRSSGGVWLAGCGGSGAQGVWHLVVGAVTGAWGLASFTPQCFLPSRHPPSCGSVSQVIVSEDGPWS